MSAELLNELKNTGRPESGYTSMESAYKALYPNSVEKWHDLVMAGKISTKLRAQVKAHRLEMSTAKTAAITKWELEHPELAAEYYAHREVVRARVRVHTDQITANVKHMYPSLDWFE